MRIHEMIEWAVAVGRTSRRLENLDEDVDTAEAATVWGSGSG
jgi:hypothetical protein